MQFWAILGPYCPKKEIFLKLIKANFVYFVLHDAKELQKDPERKDHEP